MESLHYCKKFVNLPIISLVNPLVEEVPAKESEPVKEPAEETGKETVKKPVDKIANKIVNTTAKETDEEPVEELPAKEIAIEPAAKSLLNHLLYC